MSEDDLNELEAKGADQLKWAAAERGDLAKALEMQKIECDALRRLGDAVEDPTLEADWWKSDDNSDFSSQG